MAYEKYAFAGEAMKAQKAGKIVVAKTNFGCVGFAKAISLKSVSMAEGNVPVTEVRAFFAFGNLREARAFVADPKECRC